MSRKKKGGNMCLNLSTLLLNAANGNIPWRKDVGVWPWGALL